LQSCDRCRLSCRCVLSTWSWRSGLTMQAKAVHARRFARSAIFRSGWSTESKKEARASLLCTT